MVKLPEPPSPEQLNRLGAVVHTLPAQSVTGRIYFAGGNHPTQWDQFRFWGPTGSRFDHHLRDKDGYPQQGARGIYYAACHAPPGILTICLAEVFQDTRQINLRDRDPHLVIFRTQRELQLLDLRGIWPTRVGASSAINSGPKKRVQRWSQAIYAAWTDIDGIIYPSSMGGNGDAIALYERSATALPNEPLLNRPLHDPSIAIRLYEAATDINLLISTEN